MKVQHHVIYVPGIKDDIYGIQGLLIKLWRLLGARGHIHPMPWAGQEAYGPKLERLIDKIDRLARQHHKVYLMGASAGASAVINAYMARKDKIAGVCYFAAKIQAPETVSKKTYSLNPAFKTSMYELQRNLSKLTASDKAKFYSYYSPADQIVPYEATVISGVKEYRLPALRHGQAILYCLSFGAHRILGNLKRIS